MELELMTMADDSSQEDMVRYEVAGGIAVVTLDRPERNNAWNPVMEQQYFGVLDELDVDDRVRAIVVTGAGRAFCPGVDTARLETLVGKRMDLTGRVSATTSAGYRKPLIAAINGACAGMGLVQALMCDVRFAVRGAKFTTAFARRGLAAEYGISYILPRLIGTERALDLLLSGRVVEADEAAAIGLVSRVTEPGEVLPAATAYARDLAHRCSPASMALIKNQVWAGLDAPLREAMSATYRAMDYAVGGADFNEGLQSFLQGRSPHFAPLAAEFRPEDITNLTVAFAGFRLGERGTLASADG